jgi:uncharacterized protein (UPF0297 family)
MEKIFKKNITGKLYNVFNTLEKVSFYNFLTIIEYLISGKIISGKNASVERIFSIFSTNVL